MRVVVLGGGYAGVIAARRLEQRLPEAAELIVVDDTGSHLIQHELHRVIRRPEFADQIAIPLDTILDDAEIITDRVTDIDPVAESIQLSGAGEFSYDAAAVCLGAQTDSQGIPGIQTHGQPLKCLSHAQAIRDRFDDVAPAGDQVVIGGAGLSGIQIAGELAALRDEHAGFGSVDIVLIEKADHVAPGFDNRFQSTVTSCLEDMEIEIRTGTAIKRATADTIELTTGEVVTPGQFIWAGGLRGPEALDGERPSVRADLSLAERTFAAGDTVQIIDDEGQAVPATAQSAASAGATCALNVLTALDQPRAGPSRFTFESAGWTVSVGDTAIAQVGPSVFTGTPARTLKATASLRYLVRAGAVRSAIRVIHSELYD